MISESRPQVRWDKIIWFKRGISKHKILTWLVLLNRCPTRDRLISWGLNTNSHCLLCNQGIGFRNHLYFDCNFSDVVWSPLASKLRLHVPSRAWEANTEALITYAGPKHLCYLTLLVWQATIYEIWKERNERLHRIIFRSADSLRTQIDSITRNRISSFRDQNPHAASEIIQLWFSLG